MTEDRNQAPDLSFIIISPGLRGHEVAGFAAVSINILDPYNLTTIHPDLPPMEQVYRGSDIPVDANSNHQWDIQVAPAITIVEVGKATFRVIPGLEVTSEFARKMEADLRSLIG